jgi:hypothetical protein
MKAPILGLVVIILFSCSDSRSKLHVVTRKAWIDESDRNNKIVVDSLGVYDSPYLEMTLESYKNDSGRWLEARHAVSGEKKDNGKVFKYYFFKVAGEDSKPVKFADSNMFLNYMAEHGYEMAARTKLSEYQTDFTFKRK